MTEELRQDRNGRSFRYNPDLNVSYPEWECPECGISTYGHPVAIGHRKGCPSQLDPILIFGPKSAQGLQGAIRAGTMWNGYSPEDLLRSIQEKNK